MKDYKLKLRDLDVLHTLGDASVCGGLMLFIMNFVYYESLKRELKTKNYIWIPV